MWVTVMEIGIVRVRVHQRRMNMGVSMRLPPVPRIMRVLMVLVMRVGMAVFLRLVRVRVSVLLGQVQPHPDRHQQATNNQLRA